MRAARLILLGGVAWLACQPDQAPDQDAGVAPDDGTTGQVTCPLYSTVTQVEELVIVPKCGRPGDPVCHATGNYAPRIATAGAIAPNVLEQMPTQKCRQDKLVNRATPEQSFLLAKIRARGPKAQCADGADGGPKMPLEDAPPLTREEKACLRWWIHEIAK